MVHIIIPTFNRLSHLKKLWASLRRCGVPNASTQVTFVVNGEDESTQAYLTGLAPTPIVLPCSQGTPARARNLALNQVRSAEWVLFLDDDVQLPEHYFVQALKILEQHGPDVLGGPDLPPFDATPLQRAYSFCQAHPLVTGHTWPRHCQRAGSVRQASEYELTLCHLWVRGEIFQQGFRFPPGYFRNEENVLLQQLQAEGKKILYDPELYALHFKKETLEKIIRACFVSGRYRMKSFMDYPQSLHFLFLVPAGFVLYLLALPLLSSFPLQLYYLLCLFLFAQCLWRERNLAMALWTAVLAPTIHLSYGWGLLWECFTTARRAIEIK